MSDAREEAERRYPYRDWHGFSEVLAVDGKRDAFVAGAEWAEKQFVEGLGMCPDAQVEAAREVQA